MEVTERSMPAMIKTKVCPIARIISGIMLAMMSPMTSALNSTGTNGHATAA